MAKPNIKKPATILGVKPNVIESYVKFAEENNLENFNIEEHGLKIEINREKPHEAPYRIIPASTDDSTKNQLELSFDDTPQAGPTPAPQVQEKKEEVSDSDDKYHKVTAPLVGTFYESPAPGADVYAKEGDIVNPGQALCIVEAMKVMNKINSEIKGKVAKILVDNAQPVKKGDVLFYLEPM